MVKFITDMQEGEIDILSPVKHETLIIKTLDGELIREIDPPAAGGWTHEALCNQAELLDSETELGAEAYLGSCWVGSTEV